MISFIIPNISCFLETSQAIKAIQKIPEEKEIIIVQQRNVFDFQDVKVIQVSQNIGRAKAWNLGAKEANGEFLCFMHNDMLPLEDSITKMLKEMDRKNIGIVSPQFVSDSILCSFYWVTKTGMRFPYRSFSKQTSIILNKAQYSIPILVRKEVFSEAGGFDESYSPFGWEDLDFNTTVRKRGYDRVVRMDAFFKHIGSLETRLNGLPYVEIYESGRRKYKDKWEVYKNPTGYILP